MKLAIALFGLFLVFNVASAAKQSAKEIYESLPGTISGPYCTGACIPGEPCDPPCTTLKKGNGWSCSKTEYKNSGKIQYSCKKGS